MIERFTASVYLLAAALAGPLPAQASAQTSDGPPVVVTGVRPLAPGEKPSAWKRAEAEHVVVYSDGSEDQLRRIASNIERLHVLLARLYPLGKDREEPARLKVVLFDKRSEMNSLGLYNPRVEDGPYARPFVGERYYDPRPDGSLLALPRTGQIVKLDTSKARIADCEDFLATAMGKDCLDQFPPPSHEPITRSWESILYGAYAQHVVFNHAPAIYPRWYFDGIGAFFSTVVFKNDGSLEYGRPPANYRQVLRSYGRLNTAAVLTGEYLHNPSMRMNWTPYHAWVLTHFFIFSKLKAKEAAQFRQYMTEIAQGQTMEQAAKAFGKMKPLRYHVMSYAERSHEYASTRKSEPEPPPPVVPLSQPATAAFLASLAPSPSM